MVDRVESVDRYEKLPQLTSASPPVGPPKMTVLDAVTLLIDGASSQFRYHYVDTVELSYTERLFNITEYEVGPNNRFIGPYRSQEWLPSGNLLMNTRVLNSEFQGTVRVTNVPFDKMVTLNGG